MSCRACKRWSRLAAFILGVVCEVDSILEEDKGVEGDDTADRLARTTIVGNTPELGGTIGEATEDIDDVEGDNAADRSAWVVCNTPELGGTIGEAAEDEVAGDDTADRVVCDAPELGGSIGEAVEDDGADVDPDKKELQ